MNFGNNMKKLRLEQGFTLKALSARCGVSASMLSSIEREEKAPSLKIALQIADALHATLADLIDRDSPAATIVRKNERKIIFDRLSGAEGQLLTPASSRDGVKILLVTIPPEVCTATTPPHKARSRGYLLMEHGQLRIILNHTAYDVQDGDFIGFRTDVEYQFMNLGTDECRFCLMLITPDTK